jgi:hypothetical protein
MRFSLSKKMYDPKGEYDKIQIEKEKLFNCVSHKSLTNFIKDTNNKIVDFSISLNSYGDFLFVSLQFQTNCYLICYVVNRKK